VASGLHSIFAMPSKHSTEDPLPDAGAMEGDRPSSEHNNERTPEEREREAAYRRGEERERERAAGRWATRDHALDRDRAPVTVRAFAALADNVRDYAIFLMDPQGVINYWGEGARHIKWWTRDQAEGAHLRLLYPPGGSEDGTAEDHLREAAERGEYTGEGQRIRSDGSLFWGGITLTALRDEDGRLLGFAKVTRDLTARRAADNLLQAAAEASEAASRAKSSFLATISHEIRTPVNAIIGYNELLQMETDGPLTPAQRRHLARASLSARHLLSIISEVLDFSRIDADRVSVGRTALRVGEVVAAAMRFVGPSARARRIDLVEALGGRASGLAAWGDESRVRQILISLLSNAIKFTEARGGEPGRVTVTGGTAVEPSPDAKLSGDGPWVYIRVEDTGPGVPSNSLEAIFEPFVQADMALTRAHGGTGLGLTISRRLARLMGGDVTARSELGIGSSFFLWLPAAPVESMESGGVEGHNPSVDVSSAQDPGLPRHDD
jgi:PAS domain S-box-containing protein